MLWKMFYHESADTRVTANNISKDIVYYIHLLDLIPVCPVDVFCFRLHDK